MRSGSRTRPHASSRSPSPRRGPFTVTAALLLAVACIGSLDEKPAAKSTEAFHRSYNRHEFERIWEAAAPALHENATKADYLALLRRIRQEMGEHRSSQLQQVNWETGCRGKRVNLRYASTFAQGQAVEQIVWSMDTGEPRLIGYHFTPTGETAVRFGAKGPPQ